MPVHIVQLCPLDYSSVHIDEGHRYVQSCTRVLRYAWCSTCTCGSIPHLLQLVHWVWSVSGSVPGAHAWQVSPSTV